MRELAPQDSILLPNDGLTIWVPANTWLCPLCVPQGGEGAYTSVVWIGTGDGPDGRCATCGAKLRLARQYEQVPSVDDQLRELRK